MKKLIFIITMILCSISSYSQVNNYYSKNWKQTRIERGIEQRIARETQKHYVDSMYQNNKIWASGDYLRRSANAQTASLGFAFAGIGLIAGAAAGDFGNSDNSTKNALIVLGGVCEVVSLIFYIKSINMKFKSGKSLKIAGTTITYNF